MAKVIGDSLPGKAQALERLLKGIAKHLDVIWYADIGKVVQMVAGQV